MRELFILVASMAVGLAVSLGLMGILDFAGMDPNVAAVFGFIVGVSALMVALTYGNFYFVKLRKIRSGLPGVTKGHGHVVGLTLAFFVVGGGGATQLGMGNVGMAIVTCLWTFLGCVIGSDLKRREAKVVAEP